MIEGAIEVINYFDHDFLRLIDEYIISSTPTAPPLLILVHQPHPQPQTKRVQA